MAAENINKFLLTKLHSSIVEHDFSQTRTVGIHFPKKVPDDRTNDRRWERIVSGSVSLMYTE